MIDTGLVTVVPLPRPRSTQPTSVSFRISWDKVESSALGVADASCLAIVDGRSGLDVVTKLYVRVWRHSPRRTAYRLIAKISIDNEADFTVTK